MTCGTDIGNANKYIQELCTKREFAYMGVLPSVMPENYVAMFEIPDKAAAEKIIKSAEDKLQDAIHFITEEKRFQCTEYLKGGR
jgi:hypothetical protein